ncbi:hypothetical protein FGO68_gene9455 [Halteria grandinella]|uniref:Uncharacterized protein n=1 Tax=Halteria grandinella TaxID=5974 RepID=A0A8J8P601_HALGN|nr:hypothetical protein FGO68_gene9455 [Halteria grandinella]
MNSLVMLPVQDDETFPIKYNLTIENSIFNHFSSCGSILSNYNQTQFYLNKPTYNLIFTYFMYQLYPLHLQNSINAHLMSHYHSGRTAYGHLIGDYYVSAFSRFNANMNFTRQINIRGNTFSNLNKLKRSFNDDDYYRMFHYGSLPRVQNETIRDLGLVVQIMDNFDTSYIAIEGNSFTDTQQEFWDQTYFTGKESMCNFASNQYFALVYNDILASGEDRIIQLTHLISIKQVRNSLVLIANNSFSNLTMSGPIIHIEERRGRAWTPIIIARNNFTMIHGQINSNIINIIRDISWKIYEYSHITQDLTPLGLTLEPIYMFFYSYCQYGGSIVISQNRFSYIAGCPDVDAGVLSISVKQETQKFETLPESYARNHVLYRDFSQGALFDYQWMEEKLYFASPVIHVPSAGGYIFYNRSGVNISGNEYANVSMGAQRMQDNHNIVGALIKVVNVVTTQISGEKYVNVGAHTTEFSEYLLKNILFKTTSSNNKKLLFMDQYNIDQGLVNFFDDTLSQTLISIESSLEVILGGANYFENIWLIDRIDALSRNQNMGILLRVNYLQGTITIGSSKGRTTTVKDIVGFMNIQTIEGPEYQLDISLALQTQKVSQYGAGAPLYHIHSSTNLISKQIRLTQMVTLQKWQQYFQLILMTRHLIMCLLYYISLKLDSLTFKQMEHINTSISLHALFRSITLQLQVLAQTILHFSSLDSRLLSNRIVLAIYILKRILAL